MADLQRFYAGDAVLAFLEAPWSVIFLAFIWLLHPVLGLIATGGAGVLLALAQASDALTRGRQREVGLPQEDRKRRGGGCPREDEARPAGGVQRSRSPLLPVPWTRR